MEVEEQTSAVEAPDQPEGGGRHAATSSGRRGKWAIELGIVVVVAVVIAILLRTFVVATYSIPSGSMEPTLQVGDRIVVDKLSYDLHGIDRGNIIVFSTPPKENCAGPPVSDLVKRVIGLPGDHLKIVDQQVYVNGKMLEEPYVVHDAASVYDPLNYSFPPVGSQMYMAQVQPEWAHEIRKYIQGDEIVVPPGKYFAMGDNRDHSLDSRYWGFVDRDAIMGRPFLIYWSIDANTADYSDSTFGQRIIGIFDTLMHLPARTRWNRMLHTVH